MLCAVMWQHFFHRRHTFLSTYSQSWPLHLSEVSPRPQTHQQTVMMMGKQQIRKSNFLNNISEKKQVTSAVGVTLFNVCISVSFGDSIYFYTVSNCYYQRPELSDNTCSRQCGRSARSINLREYILERIVVRIEMIIELCFVNFQRTVLEHSLENS